MSGGHRGRAARSAGVSLRGAALVALLVVVATAALALLAAVFIDGRVYRAVAVVDVRVDAPSTLYLNSSQRSFPSTQLTQLAVSTLGVTAEQQLNGLANSPSAPKRVVIASGFSVLAVAQDTDPQKALVEATGLAHEMRALQKRLQAVSILPKRARIHLSIASTPSRATRVFPSRGDVARAIVFAAVAGCLLAVAMLPRLPWRTRVDRAATGRLSPAPTWLRTLLIALTALACATPAGGATTVAGVWVALLAFVVFVDAPAWVWAAVAVTVALLERAATAGGLAPSAANFLDYPIVVVAFAVAVWRRRSRPDGWMLCAAGLAVACVVTSAVASHAGPMRAALDALVFAEPWLLAAAIVLDPPPPESRRRLLAGVVFAGAVEAVVALVQVVDAGSVGDSARGTLVGNATASHLVGGIGLVAGATAVMLGLTTGCRAWRRAGWLAAGAVLAATPLLTDAKQVYLVAPLAVLVALPARRWWRRLRVRTLALLLIGLAVVGVGAFRAVDWYNAHESSDAFLHVFFSSRSGKVISAKAIARDMSAEPGRWVVGLGPGETVSRVALLSKGGYVRADSAISRLGFVASPLTREILGKTLNQDLQKSSLLSGWGSDLGLWGDFGVLGALLYLGGCVWVAAAARGPYRFLVRFLVPLSLLLGFIDSWLEQPSYILVIALVVGALLPARFPVRETPRDEVSDPVPRDAIDRAAVPDATA